MWSVYSAGSIIPYSYENPSAQGAFPCAKQGRFGLGLGVVVWGGGRVVDKMH